MSNNNWSKIYDSNVYDIYNVIKEHVANEDNYDIKLENFELIINIWHKLIIIYNKIR
jgi:hypothetical protein